MRWVVAVGRLGLVGDLAAVGEELAERSEKTHNEEVSGERK